MDTTSLCSIAIIQIKKEEAYNKEIFEEKHCCMKTYCDLYFSQVEFGSDTITRQ
jgi:hypothetical protein